MKIYVDTIAFDLQKTGGISVYWYEIITSLLNDKEMDLVLIVSKKQKDNIFWEKLDLSHAKILTINTNRYLNLNYKEQEKHIFISTYYRTSKNKNAINITLVHDFTYEKFSKGLSGFVHHVQKKNAIQYAQAVICISKNTLEDLNSYFPWYQGKKAVIYNGVSSAYGILTEKEKTEKLSTLPKTVKEVVQKKYLLYVGMRSKYKNWDKAVAILKLLPEYHLITVGGQALAQGEQDLLGNDKNRHLYLSAVDQDVLKLLYNNASCLIYLSEYEGFGIPVIEAQKCGCPVLAMNKSSIPEIANGTACLLEAWNDPSIQKAIDFIQNEKTEANKAGIENSKRFSWQKTYMELKSFLKEVI